MSEILTLGYEIEQIRCECGMPIFIMYGIFDTDEIGYRQIITRRKKPSIFHLIMFVDTTHHPMKSIVNRDLDTDFYNPNLYAAPI